MLLSRSPQTYWDIAFCLLLAPSSALAPASGPYTHNAAHNYLYCYLRGGHPARGAWHPVHMHKLFWLWTCQLPSPAPAQRQLWVQRSKLKPSVLEVCGSEAPRKKIQSIKVCTGPDRVIPALSSKRLTRSASQTEAHLFAGCTPIWFWGLVDSLPMQPSSICNQVKVTLGEPNQKLLKWDNAPRKEHRLNLKPLIRFFIWEGSLFDSAVLMEHISKLLESRENADNIEFVSVEIESIN